MNVHETPFKFHEPVKFIPWVCARVEHSEYLARNQSNLNRWFSIPEPRSLDVPTNYSHPEMLSTMFLMKLIFQITGKSEEKLRKAERAMKAGNYDPSNIEYWLLKTMFFNNGICNNHSKIL